MREISEDEALDIIDNLVKTGKVSRENINSSIQSNETICVNCGCSDYRACHDGCWWVDIESSNTLGICSNCEDILEDWE
ncbi:hypothetical protein ACNSOL_12155 (plasmid) [Aliarcobacter lanthieri]|uniref:hypothetical protein n=1 Tax=Aliarcobacter lanthieri TaxID=1355374 RepID=UPI003AADD8D7